MANRYLKKVGYKPQKGGRAQANSSGRSDAASLDASTYGRDESAKAPSSLPVPALDLKKKLTNVLASESFRYAFVIFLASSAAIGHVILKYVTPQSGTVDPLIIIQKERPLYSLKVERALDESAARAKLNTLDPSLRALFFDWNAGARRNVVGANSIRRAPIWLPLTRPGLEKEFRALSHSGLAGIWMNEVYPPETWSEEDLDARLYKWASKCAVEKDSILKWSSFRSSLSLKLENQCRPGGLCVILSDGPCQGNTFDEINLVG